MTAAMYRAVTLNWESANNCRGWFHPLIPTARSPLEMNFFWEKREGTLVTESPWESSGLTLLISNCSKKLFCCGSGELQLLLLEVDLTFHHNNFFPGLFSGVASSVYMPECQGGSPIIWKASPQWKVLCSCTIIDFLIFVFDF